VSVTYASDHRNKRAVGLTGTFVRLPRNIFDTFDLVFDWFADTLQQLTGQGQVKLDEKTFFHGVAVT